MTANKPKKTLGRRLRRILVVLLAVIVGLAIVGAIYQAIGQALDRRALSPPGRRVAVEGLSMHLHCLGEGGPTVVLEAGATGFAQVWSRIQPRLAAHARVCSYDRAGLGWSDEGEGHDGLAIAGRLHALLEAAGEAGPYVLVGHSLGGVFIRDYAARYPDEVIALGFVDPSHPDQIDRLPGDGRADQARLLSGLAVATTLAYVGVIRLADPLSRLYVGLPPDDLRAASLFGSTPAHLRASRAELLAWDATAAAAKAAGDLGDRPALVLSASAPLEGMSAAQVEVLHELHAEIAALSRRGRQRTIDGADHMSLLTDEGHAATVADALIELIDEARAAPASP